MSAGRIRKGDNWRRERQPLQASRCEVRRMEMMGG